MITPLPAARPSALSTNGKLAAISSSACSRSRSVRCAAVGTPASSIASFRVQLRALEPRRRAARTEGGDALRLEQVDEPRDERRLGPDHDEVDGLLRPRRAAPRRRRRRSAQRASAAMPALPGAQSSSGCCGERASARTIACSRPPPPTTRTFKWLTSLSRPLAFRGDRLQAWRTPRPGSPSACGWSSSRASRARPRRGPSLPRPAPRRR